MIAAESNHPELVKKLIELGADFKATTTDGLNALYVAAWNGDEETVRLLCKRGADPNVANVDGWEKELEELKRV